MVFQAVVTTGLQILVFFLFFFLSLTAFFSHPAQTMALQTLSHIQGEKKKGCEASESSFYVHRQSSATSVTSGLHLKSQT